MASIKEGPTVPSKQTSEHTLRAWLAVFGAMSAFFCSVGFINAFGVFQEHYRSHQLNDHSDFDISWIGSFSTFALFASAPLTGILVDRYGPTILLIGGSSAMLLAVFMTSLCTEYYQFFLAQALLLGSSMSFVFCPALATVSRYFVKNRGLALGVTVGGSSAGGVVWPIVINELLNEDGVSFGWTIRIVGFIMLPLLILTVLTVRSPRKPEQHHDERLVNQEGHGERISLEVQEKPEKECDVSIAKNPTFLLLCIGLAICYLGMFSPFFFVTSYAKGLGHPVGFAFYLVSIVNAASFFGRDLPGFLADRYGHFNLCSAAAFLSGVIALSWTGAENTAGLAMWSLMYGFASGAIMSLQASCAGHLATHETHGTAMGFLMGSVALTALFGTPISGQLVGSYGYLGVSMYAGSTLIVGSLLIFWARLRLNKSIFAKQ